MYERRVTAAEGHDVHGRSHSSCELAYKRASADEGATDFPARVKFRYCLSGDVMKPSKVTRTKDITGHNDNNFSSWDLSFLARL